jgi:NAD(P)-dependent dehydrogenase (short-subunit alcohol dehydrogenase family)
MATVTATNKPARAALVTGASTGIGYATVDALARTGALVYAGFRKDADADRLRELGENVRPVALDVTKSEDIGAAADVVRGGNVPLQAVICNAGIALGGPLEFMPLDRLRYQLEVNLVGALAVAQATLPLLRQTRGRLIFVGSISGRITPPFVGPYAASKAALAALTDALRSELDSSGSGISVTLFEFGDFQTPIWEKGANAIGRLKVDTTPEMSSYYGFAADTIRRSIERSGRGAAPAESAARAIARAALGPRPRARYRLGRGASLAVMASMLPAGARGRLVRKAMGLP